MRRAGRWVWVSSPPPGYQAMTVPVPPPGAVLPPSAAPLRAGAGAGPAAPDAILGKDLSSRELGVLQTAASLKAAHVQAGGASPHVEAGGASPPLRTFAPASSPSPPAFAPAAPRPRGLEPEPAVEESTGEGRRTRQGGARGRDAGAGGETYGAKELAAQVERFEDKSLAAIAAGLFSVALALARRKEGCGSGCRRVRFGSGWRAVVPASASSPNTASMCSREGNRALRGCMQARE